MKTLLPLVPLAIGLVIFAAVMTVVLQKNLALGSWLLAAFLLGHGLIHIMFAAPPPATASTPGAEFAFDVSRSWPVAMGINVGIVRALVLVLVVAVVGGYALAAMATAGVLIPANSWPSLVVAATAASAVLMVVGLSPGLVLGIAIDVVLLWVVLSSVWSPGRLLGS